MRSQGMPFENDAFFCRDLLRTEAASLPMHIIKDNFCFVPTEFRVGQSMVALTFNGRGRKPRTDDA
jgi:hypothetical protein